MTTSLYIGAIIIMLVLQAVLWCLISWFTGWYVGWRALAIRFPHRAHGRVAERAGGLIMIGERWGGSIAVHADAEGIAVAPAPLMRIGRAPFLLPWAGITTHVRTASPVVASLHLEIDGTQIAFFGKAAELVGRALVGRAGGGASTSSA